MFLIQTLHTALTLFFPVLNQYCNSDPSKIFSIKPFFYFVGVAGLILSIYAFDNIRTYSRSENTKKLLKFLKYTILAPLEAITYTTILYTQASEVKFRILVAIGGILIFVVSILGASIFQKHGLKEILFVTFLCPIFFLCSTMLLFQEVDFKLLVKFGPINFLFLGTWICYGARKTAMTRDQASHVWSLAILLGKQDSFRALFLMIAYCYVHAFIESFQQLSIMHLVPIAVFTVWFYKILYAFRSEKYEESFSYMWKTYIIYSVVFVLCTVVL